MTVSDVGITTKSPAFFISTIPPLIVTLNVSLVTCSIVAVSLDKLTVITLPTMVLIYIAEFSRLSVRFTLKGVSDVDVEPSIILTLSILDANCGNGNVLIGIYKSTTASSGDIIYWDRIELIFVFTFSRSSCSVALSGLSIINLTYVLSNCVNEINSPSIIISTGSGKLGGNLFIVKLYSVSSGNTTIVKEVNTNSL